MTIGEKIKIARLMRKITQKELALLIDLPDVRIRQYETNIRTPKEKQLQEIAGALGVPIEFFKNHSIDSILDIMHVLFELDNNIGINISSNNDSIHPSFSISFNNTSLNNYIGEWKKIKDRVKNSSELEDYYKEWIITFPNKFIDESHDKLLQKRNNSKNNPHE